VLSAILTILRKKVTVSFLGVLGAISLSGNMMATWMFPLPAFSMGLK